MKKYSHKVEKPEVTIDKLGDPDATLTSFLFPIGSNIYIFSYPRQGGEIHHTLIDTGFLQYSGSIEAMFIKNNINISNIDNIILSHHHGDHCGLAALMAQRSNAQILVSHSFRKLVEEGYVNEDKFLLRYFDPASFKTLNVKYLEEKGKLQLDGMDFPILEEFNLAGGSLTILSCPRSDNMHTDNQVIVLYKSGNSKKSLTSTEDLLFSGDLWLMAGPDIKSNPRMQLRVLQRQLKGYFSENLRKRFTPQEQDIDAKEALKKAFISIRVKPGHGKEFLGTQMLPNCILSRGEIDEQQRILKADEASVFDHSYQEFNKELLELSQAGYQEQEIVDFLSRIYIEQSGGTGSVKNERKQRRIYLESLLKRLDADKNKPENLRRLASITLSKLQ